MMKIVTPATVADHLRRAVEDFIAKPTRANREALSATADEYRDVWTDDKAKTPAQAFEGPPRPSGPPPHFSVG